MSAGEVIRGTMRSARYLSMDLGGHSAGLVGGINGFKEGFALGRRSSHPVLYPLPAAVGGFIAKGGGNWLLPATYKTFAYTEGASKYAKAVVAVPLDVANLVATAVGTGATFPVGHISGPVIKTGLNVVENALVDVAGLVKERAARR